jgi:hypothetical protein
MLLIRCDAGYTLIKTLNLNAFATFIYQSFFNKLLFGLVKIGKRFGFGWISLAFNLIGLFTKYAFSLQTQD